MQRPSSRLKIGKPIKFLTRDRDVTSKHGNGSEEMAGR